MISLKKYLDKAESGPFVFCEPEESDLLAAVLAAYRASLLAMGNCAQAACPALGDGLKQELRKLEAEVCPEMSPCAVSTTEHNVQLHLQDWGQHTARHYQEKADEVRELLLLMARTAESVGVRDQRCAGQIHEVTRRLASIECLEDLSEIRASIKKSAAELKTEIDRMTEEGKAAIEHLQAEVSNYQTRLEKAEEVAFRDTLTGLCSRLCVENQLVRRIGEQKPFCVAIIDIDAFKLVNDAHGHVTGDDLLKQFAVELRSACRANDLIGRWGGDEFIIVFDSGMDQAGAQTDRLRKWVCGQYEVQGKAGKIKLTVNASIGLAEFRPGEAMTDLLARADSAMYENKAASRAPRN
ncbi:MAG TPA: GGDEF domain-containing protein [Acidobacteriaceae bacterium]|nr:GGDEF domain-containing protein [Acidobacteriaceae bacterium]